MTIAPAMSNTTDDWSTRGMCVGIDPDALFVQGKEQRTAKQVCRGCPVALECLADALQSGAEFGVWGGLTERERRALLRQHPDVADWRAVLERSRGSGGLPAGRLSPAI